MRRREGILCESAFDMESDQRLMIDLKKQRDGMP